MLFRLINYKVPINKADFLAEVLSKWKVLGFFFYLGRKKKYGNEREKVPDGRSL